MSESLTDRQIEARRAHIDAIKAYRMAGKGERGRTKRRLTEAAVEVLAADVEAERCRKAEAA